MASETFSYTTVTGKIKPLFEKITDVAVPGRVTHSWLASIGFTSSNDRTLMAVLRQVMFVDSSDVPTELWKRYRASDRTALAEGVRSGFESVYDVYADAHQRSNQELTNVFKAKATSLGNDTVAKVLATFRALCSLAEFEGESVIDAEFKELPRGGRNPRHTEPGADQGTEGFLAVPVGFNLHIHLPADGDRQTYRVIFEELRATLSGTSAPALGD